MKEKSKEELAKEITTLKKKLRNLEEENKKLHFSDDLFNITGQISRVGGWELNVEKQKVYWTKTTRMIHEAPDDFEPTLEQAISFFPGASGKIISNVVQEAINEGKNFDVRTEFETAKGNRLWVRSIGRSVFEDGKCRRLYGTFQDVSDIKKTEDKLRDTLAQSKQTEMEISELLTATNAVLEKNDFEVVARKIFDACSRVIGARAGYVALLSEDGQENELLFLEDGGMPCDVNPELPMPIRGLRAEAYHTGKAVYDNDFMNSKWVNYMPKGHMDLANVLFAPLNIKGETVGIMGLAIKKGGFTDHDAKLAKAFGEYAAIALENSRAYDALEKNIKEKEILIREIHHRVKNNMQVISAMLQLQASEIGDERITAIMEEAQSRVNSMSKVHEMMYRTKDLQHIDISMYIDEMIGSLTSLYPVAERGITISSQCKEVYLNLNQAIPTGLIVNELVSNAMKHAFPDDKGGTITVTVEQKKDDVIIKVCDDGVGVPEEFDIKKVESMGLEIVNLLTEQLKGSIKVKGDYQGSIFEITFPIA